mmetsp:Transcript_44800/g.124164  ORF Transcript_44800/g.124164 Transcript_44800/m.124164 type:complete len:214 (+) Transcript_44800:227-868(+)
MSADRRKDLSRGHKRRRRLWSHPVRRRAAAPETMAPLEVTAVVLMVAVRVMGATQRGPLAPTAPLLLAAARPAATLALRTHRPAGTPPVLPRPPQPVPGTALVVPLPVLGALLAQTAVEVVSALSSMATPPPALAEGTASGVASSTTMSGNRPATSRYPTSRTFSRTKPSSATCTRSLGTRLGAGCCSTSSMRATQRFLSRSSTRYSRMRSTS